MALRVWLPLNGSVENKGISDTIMSGSPASWGNGKIGKCATFTGNTSNVIYNNTTDYNYTDNFSWAVWINTNFTGTTGQYAFTNGRADAGGYGYGLQCSNTTTCNIKFGNQSYGVTVTGGEWTHLAFTKSGTSIKIYKNGSIVTDTTFTGTLPTYSDGNGLGLGCFHYSGNIYPFYGSLNDFRIYDHCLSPKEVKEISQGLVLHYKLDEIIGNNLLLNSDFHNGKTNWSGVNSSILSIVQKDGTQTITATKGTTNNLFCQSSQWTHTAGQTTVFTFSARIYSELTGTITGSLFIASDGWKGAGSFSWKNNNINIGWNEVEATVTANTATYTGPLIVCIGFSNTTFFMANPKFELGTAKTGWGPASSEAGTYIPDSSGYGNDGAVTGLFSVESDSCRYDISTKSLNGTDCVKSPLSLVDVQSFTCSFWVKPSPSNGGYSILASNYNNPGSGFWISTNCESHALWFYNSAYADTVATSISNDNWHHCVIVCNNKIFSMYIDGVQQTLNRTTSSSKTITINNLSVFNSYTGTSWNTKRYGNISDFRFYISALSSEDILDLYHTSANIDDLGNLHGFEFIEGESKQSIYKNGQIATKYELQNNLWSGTQINASNMAVTYNYQTDVFRNYGFDTCMKFTPTHIADGTSWYGYSYICDNTIVHNLAETYTFSMYAYVSTDCNANFRVHTEHENPWVSNYQGTTANINDTTKGQVIKVWGKAKTNASDGKIYLMFYFNPHLIDTFTTGYILVAGLNVVIGDTIYPPGIMPMNGFNQDKNISSIKNDLIIMNDFIEK